MKDDSFWMVVREGASLHSGIRCEGGKSEAKELRKEMQQRHGGEWKTIKTTKKELAATA